MKFKYLVIAFSIVIIIVLLIMVLLPVFIASAGIAVSFKYLSKYLSLPLIVFMVLTLLCFWIFFLFNYRLFSLLEREDWPALAYYLEQKIFVKERYSNRNVRLLSSSYMVISDYASVLKLESKASLAKPAVVNKNILIFGAARILSGKYTDAAAFLKTQLDKNKLREKDKEWVRWFYGFSHLLNGAFNRIEPDFILMARSSGDALITGLSAYFLCKSLAKHSSNPQDCNAAAENGRERVVKALKNPGGWKRELDKMSTEIHITIIRKHIDETGKWLFQIP